MAEHARYPSLKAHWKARFGERVWRVSLDAGFGCPHRDPETGAGGCVFCDPAAFAPSAGSLLPVGEQLDRRIAKLRERGIGKFAAYFQPGTNTWGPVEKLAAAWDEAAHRADVVALCVGTRPDRVGEKALAALASYGGRFGEIWLELGLQSAHDATLQRLNRGHGAEAFRDACERARARGLLVCAHVILGLPGEGEAEEAQTAGFLRSCRVEGVKLHHLAVVRGTELEKMHRRGEVETLDGETYARRAAAFIRHLAPATVVHRYVGDSYAHKLVAPVLGKPRVIRRIRELLAE